MASHQFRGKARRRKKRGGWSQASTRRGIILYDQHGRQWSGQVSNKSGMPTGQIDPCFTAPWYPDQQYLRVNPDNQAELYIDYDAMLLRRRARLEEFHKLATEFAREKKLELPKKGEYSEAITRAIGGMPKPIQPVAAAMQKNPYILGLTDRVDPRLERYVVKPRNEAILDEFDFHPETAGDFSATKARNEAAKVEKDEWLSSDETKADVDVEEFDGLTGADASDAFDVEGALDDLDEEKDDELDLDEEHDQEAVGGRTIAARNAEKAQRQAPRRPGTKVARPKQGAARSGTSRAAKAAAHAQRTGRKTLANGGRPVISGQS